MLTTIQSQVRKTEHGISLSGDFVFSNIVELKEQCDRYLEQNNSSMLLFDCSEIQRLDSAGIALLVSWKRQSKNAKKDCRFEALPNQAQALIEAYHLQSLLDD